MPASIGGTLEAITTECEYGDRHRHRGWWSNARGLAKKLQLIDVELGCASSIYVESANGSVGKEADQHAEPIETSLLSY
jgi:hypothetical protein